MSLKQPESMDECVYFTRRTVGNGRIMAWVLREKCPKCGKAVMGKPRDDEGTVKIRAKEYVCESCGYTVGKEEYEDTLTANIEYTCQHCGNSGETQIPFKRKKLRVSESILILPPVDIEGHKLKGKMQNSDEEEQKKVTVEALRFQCSKCRKDIYVTKKMK